MVSQAFCGGAFDGVTAGRRMLARKSFLNLTWNDLLTKYQYLQKCEGSNHLEYLVLAADRHFYLFQKSSTQDFFAGGSADYLHRPRFDIAVIHSFSEGQYWKSQKLAIGS